jgi:hypothetical protein
MKAAIVALSLVAPLAVAAAPVAAQQDPVERARIEELTRRLNGAPPAPQSAPAQAPVSSRPTAPAAPPPASLPDATERARIEELTRRLNGAPSAPASVSVPAPAASSAPAPAAAVAPRPSPAPSPAPRPVQEARPEPAPASPTATTRPAAEAPASRPAAPVQTAPAPDPQGLSAAERAVLPFRIDLPSGFQLVEGRAAPGAHVYSARKAGKTFVMIYAGPSSQFPIYDGEQATVGGRISVVTTEGPRRIAMEHLFQRSGEPAEIHVWVMAQDGADRDEAERIAQTVDPK